MVQNMDFISRTAAKEFRHGIGKIRFAFIKVNFIAAQGMNCRGTFKAQIDVKEHHNHLDRV